MATSRPGGDSAPTMTVDYRGALASDCREIAGFLCMSGGALYEFLFDELSPFLTAIDVLSFAIARERYSISHHNWAVAFDTTSGKLLGAANVFPADDLKNQPYWFLRQKRRSHIQPLLEVHDWGSMFLNALAVSADCRGLGIGTRLLNWAEWRTQSAGLDRLSLHVWADNTNAVNFYKARGFVEYKIASVARHPKLVHIGGSILMRRVTGYHNSEPFDSGTSNSPA